jgi:hypothetical protein
VAEAAGIAATFDVGELTARLHRRFGSLPGEEDRWIDAPEVRRRPGLSQRLAAAYRPTFPAEWLSNPKSWLSNLDIDAVMHQYQAHLGPTRGFRYVGLFPRDFAAPKQGGTCVSEAMCRLRVKDLLAEGVRQFGCVFNLDKHTGRGSHWTACYVGLEPERRPHRFGFFYYDSVGNRPPAEMRAFGERVRAEVAEAMGPEAGEAFAIKHNRIRKQFLDSECGIYAMFFVVSSVQTEASFETLCRDVMRRDKDMHELRDVFFRPPPKPL